MLSRHSTLRDFVYYHIESGSFLHDHQIRLIFPVNKHNEAGRREEYLNDAGHEHPLMDLILKSISNDSQVTMKTKLYSGMYGNTLEATIKQTSERVIAKSYHRSTRSMEAANQFHLEITLLKQYSHQNIVR